MKALGSQPVHFASLPNSKESNTNLTVCSLKPMDYVRVHKSRQLFAWLRFTFRALLLSNGLVHTPDCLPCQQCATVTTARSTNQRTNKLWCKAQQNPLSCCDVAKDKQESCAIAKMTAQCALHMGALKIFGTPYTSTATIPNIFMGFCSGRSYECSYKI